MLLSEAATVEEGCGEKVLEIDDVSRAFFEAPAITNVCVEIPAEDRDEADVKHDRVGANEPLWYAGCGHELAGGGRARNAKVRVPARKVQPLPVLPR